MGRYRNYWVYSAALLVVWAVLLLLVSTLRGGSVAHMLWLLFAGFCIGWVSTTIARYVYPPPGRWRAGRDG